MIFVKKYSILGVRVYWSEIYDLGVKVLVFRFRFEIFFLKLILNLNLRFKVKYKRYF